MQVEGEGVAQFHLVPVDIYPDGDELLVLVGLAPHVLAAVLERRRGPPAGTRLLLWVYYLRRSTDLGISIRVSIVAFAVDLGWREDVAVVSPELEVVVDAVPRVPDATVVLNLPSREPVLVDPVVRLVPLDHESAQDILVANGDDGRRARLGRVGLGRGGRRRIGGSAGSGAQRRAGRSSRGHRGARGRIG